MKTNLRKALFALVLGAAMLLTACGGGGASSNSGGGSTASGGAATLDFGSDGENLAFAPATASVAAGASVTVKFKNNSAAQQHNWVLVKGDDTVAQTVAQAGLAAGAEKGYLADDKTNVVAASKLANGGESVDVTFTAPAAGTYTFICTVPGHYPLMKGTLTVN